MKQDIIVLSDYDGTICPTQMLDFLFEGFSEVGMKYADLWEQGVINTQEEIESTFASVSASQEAMEARIANIPLDPDFPAFLDLCEQNAMEFAIVSDGLRWYIDFMLGRDGIRGIEIYANEIQFSDDGFQFEYPHFHEECPARGVCKSQVVTHFHQAGKQVIFIGDGLSDFEAADVADLVYATDQLAAYCRQKGLPAVEFVDFSDLVKRWRQNGPPLTNLG